MARQVSLRRQQAQEEANLKSGKSLPAGHKPITQNYRSPRDGVKAAIEMFKGE
jgi:hypothetical protein